MFQLAASDLCLQSHQEQQQINMPALSLSARNQRRTLTQPLKYEAPSSFISLGPRSRRGRRRAILIALVVLLGLTYVVLESRAPEGSTLLSRLLKGRDHYTQSGLDYPLPGDDRFCKGWSPQAEKDGPKGKWKKCWRSTWHKQISGYDAMNPINGPERSVLIKNHRALQSIKACLPYGDVKNKRVGILVDGKVEEVVCRDRMYGVVLLHWWLATLPFRGFQESGETIWMASQIEALDALGYSVIASQGYTNGVDMYEAMPDVIAYIWGEDHQVWSCQVDPYCSAHVVPTLEAWPFLDLSPESEFSQRRKKWAKKGYERKWIWTREELDAIPEGRRGKIPNHKLFSTTYWGWNPSSLGGAIREENPAPNPLGARFTITPFAYPNHTYMPFSVEKLCATHEYIPHSERENQVFVLAKQAKYFNDKPDLHPDPKDWVRIQKELGMKLVTTAVSGKDPKKVMDIVPVGVDSIGTLPQENFIAELGKSRVLLLLGRPPISPSVYDALCQGTPVVIPWQGEEPEDSENDPWYHFSTAISQHGPALELGEPFTYGYRFTDTDDLIAKTLEAVRNPIQSFVPPDMTFEAILEQVDRFMKTDWKRLADHIVAGNGGKMPVVDWEGISWCHDVDRCRNYEDNLEWDGLVV